MKQSTSIHISEDIMSEIDEYKNKYNISRSSAIERMLLERRFFMNYNLSGKIQEVVPNTIQNNEVSVKSEVSDSKKQSNLSPTMRKSIVNTFESIPDAPED